jgi:hypothetical protein
VPDVPAITCDLTCDLARAKMLSRQYSLTVEPVHPWQAAERWFVYDLPGHIANIGIIKAAFCTYGDL